MQEHWPQSKDDRKKVHNEQRKQLLYLCIVFRLTACNIRLLRHSYSLTRAGKQEEDSNRKSIVLFDICALGIFCKSSFRRVVEREIDWVKASIG